MSALARSDVSARDVEHALHAAHRPAHRAAVEHVAVDEVDVEAGQLGERTSAAHECPHVVAALTSRRVTCDPTRPVAPVTRVVIAR